MALDDNIEEAYKKYSAKTNMSFKDLLSWSKDPCSKKASLDLRPICRNLVLLGTPKEAWTPWHAHEARKMLSFEARHSAGSAGKEVKGCGISKRSIARKNWAVDPNKK